MVSLNYPCSQADLYNINRDAWYSCSLRLSDFAAVKSKYTEAYVAEALALVNAADALPDSTSRYAPTKNLRVDLIDCNNEVLDCFDLLMGYIEEAFRADKVKTMKEDAGQKYVTKAKALSWSGTTSLLSSAMPFLTKYKDVLISDGFMPLTFYDRFVAAKKAFEATYKAWNTSDKASFELTDDKINANNDIYARLNVLLSDAQKALKKDEQAAKQFTLAFLLSQARGTKAAGFKGKVTIGETKKTLAEATISILSLGKSEVTDKNGRYDFSPLASGFYAVQVEAEGYETAVFEKYEVEIGKVGRLNIALQPVAVTAVVAEKAMA